MNLYMILSSIIGYCLILVCMMKNNSEIANANTSITFGLRFSHLTEQQVAKLVVDTIRSKQDGVGLIITPNIQHISLLEKNFDLVNACQKAEILSYDGFPLVYYAKLRGAKILIRTTGRGVVEKILEKPEKLHCHKIFMILDSETTLDAARTWSNRNKLNDNIAYAIPPYGFENDDIYTAKLLSDIIEFKTTILFMGIGAPKSEIFVNINRCALPPCWALCIGQALQVAFGCRPTPPRFIQTLNLEWLWRIRQEPKRLLPRYIKSAFLFLKAIARDIFCHD